MPLTQTETRALFILLPALAVVFRFGAGRPQYLVFFVLIWAGAVTELLSVLGSHLYHTNVLNANVYVLLEFILLLLFFYRFIPHKKQLLTILLVCGVLTWLFDNLLWHSLQTVNSFFRVYYSLCILFISLWLLNTGVTEKRLSLFLICLGCIIYYSCKAIIESFYMLHLGFSRNFYYAIFVILSWLNLLTNLIYTAAILCIPRRQNFTTAF